jgi:hypothetical protein
MAELMVELTADPLGNMSASVYETGRLLALAPWLDGADGRVEFFFAKQKPHGCWGGPGGYGLVSTLSATDALLSVLRCRSQYPLASAGAADRGQLAAAADRGLAVLLSRSPTAGNASLPDTVAAEIIVPALVTAVNGHLARLSAEPSHRSG